MMGHQVLSVAHDIYSCKHSLCWNVSLITNKVFGFISQTFFSFNNVRLVSLTSIVHENFAEINKKMKKKTASNEVCYVRKK